MVRVVNDKNEFKDLNQHSWKINADFIIENGFPHIDIENLLSKEIYSLHKKNKNLSRVLDVGCGTGWLKKIIPDTLSYIGVDNCVKFISKLSEKEDSFHLLDIEKQYPLEKLQQFQSDILVCSLSLIETPFLDQAFKNINLLTKENGFVIIVGLNPTIELLRVSKTLNDLENYLELYKSTDSNLSISKTIKSKGAISDTDYHRILYSPNDYIRLAKENDFALIDFKDGLNKGCKLSEPVYQYFLFKKQ
ncbi:methyltransferase domain-containing protein [Kordia jejudonensis]|uniref:methyltransferase domain-containing protein n=1 Tax=Kordia jejudonensis TaxID=1348245 RepID=UPI000629644E|nr:class I SAM-dependent methyltransferase [Kordia jejudonensis]